MIEINNMSFAYRKARHNIHTDLNLDIEKGKIYGLLGKNGTGKSTLLYLICGLLRPQNGEITLDGIPTLLRRQETLKQIFLLNEDFTLPAVRISEWARSLGGFYPRYSEELFSECLKDFDIEGDSNMRMLSMGQKKKIMISFALASGTEYLLMDEPTNGLDIPSKTQFRKAVSKCMTDDRAIIISTHQVHDVELLLDHIIIIDKDKILLNASTDEITQKYSFGYYMPGAPVYGIIYQEPSLQGNATMSHRKEGDPETNINLELLFNAIISPLTPERGNL